MPCPRASLTARRPVFYGFPVRINLREQPIAFIVPRVPHAVSLGDASLNGGGGGLLHETSFLA
jgi:hypothetical protein